MLAAALSTAGAQTAAPTAEQVKAAYLLKFAGYVEWPAKAFADAAAPLVIGVVGGDGVRAELTRLAAGRPIAGRPVDVRRLAATPASPDAHIVYVGRDAGADALAAVGAAYRGRPVLTIADVPQGLERGVVLNFVEVDKRVRFEAAPPVAELGGLHLSSRLLAVAERVVGGAP